MNKYRNRPDDILGVVQGILARLDKLERYPRIGNTAIDAGNLTVKKGNSVVIQDDGSLTVLDKHGATVAFIGRNANAFGAGVGQSLVQFFRPDGTKVFEATSGDIGAPPQANSFRFFDTRTSDQSLPIISDHATAGALRDPMLAISWAHENVAQINSSSSTLVPIARAAFYMYHYMTQIECDITCPASNTGEIVVAMDFPGTATFTVAQKSFDNTTASPMAINAYTQSGASAGLAASDPGYVAGIYNGGGPDVQNWVRLVVNVHRTSGAGTVSARVRSWNNGGA